MPPESTVKRARGIAARRRGAPSWAPEPPVELPPGRLVHVPRRGEFFLRDTGGDGPPVLLLHGWCVSADLNWFRTYQPLADAGFRVLAVDHRGHGRGLRTPADFRLADCADDAAGVLETIGVSAAFVVGYSMGGPIASLMARNHPDRVTGLVLCATAPDWQHPRMKRVWRSMAAFRGLLGAFPNASWRRALRLAGFPDSPITTWYASELTRGSAKDVAEAGRELGRYDGRPWLGSLSVPAAVIVTAGDNAVPVYKQRELASLLDAPAIDAPGDHGAVVAEAGAFAERLLEALERVGAPARAPVG
jgi:pimeloyl-ACP methyl ester carboxylesterase